ncbi:MAG: sialidase family protein [Verrucomicrobia bacterium]|nr:sialidase family protein [Verrucomicrobiota bacterium]
MKIAWSFLFFPLIAFAMEPRSVPEAEHVVIYRQAGQYSAFPRLFKLPDGTLHVHFRARVTSSHLEPRSETKQFVSKDGGRTWQPTDQDAVDPTWATGPSKPGRLVDANAHAWRYVEASRREEFEKQGIEVRDSPDGRVTYAYGCYVRTSEDNGATWKEREIPVPPKGLIMSFIGPATDLRLDANTLLCSVYGRPTANIRFYETWLLRSENDGRTWDFLTVAADPEKKRSFGETSIEQAANGDIVAMMRTEPALGTKMWTAHSTDRGKTWSKATETNLHGHPPHLLTLRDGTMICTYGYRDEPIGIRTALSRDNGRTWLEKDIVSLRADGSSRGGDNGYPISAELADGSLVSVYYITREGITGVEATRWQNPWK